MQSVKRSPEFQIQRLVTANETGPFTDKTGINLKSYKTALIQVIPVTETALEGQWDEATFTPGTSDPEIEVFSWSPPLQQFIRHNPDSVLPGQGAGIAYEFKVETYGQILYVAVTNGITTNEGVLIAAAGYEPIEASC